MKNILFGIMAGFTTGTIVGVILTSGRSVTIRKKIMAQGEAYLEAATKKFNDRLANLTEDLSERFDRKLEKQVRSNKHKTAL